MWETAFDPSMLAGSKVIINCPSKDLVQELMNVLAENGVRWGGVGEAPNRHNSRWNDYEEETCYWVENHRMTYESKQYADDDEDDEFENHIRCTFYGIVSDDFEPASNNELMDFLGL